MKLRVLLLSAILLLFVCAGCRQSAGEPAPQEAQSSEVPAASHAVSDTRQTDDPETPLEPEPEEDAAQVQTAVAAAAYPETALVVRVVDSGGRPVAHVTGMLELGIADENTTPPALPLWGNGDSPSSTGADGALYYSDDPALLSGECALLLTAYYDASIRQRIPLEPSEQDGYITVTWTGDTPPSDTPAPATRRINFQIVDEEGVPVAGVHGALDQMGDAASSRMFLAGTGADAASTDDGGCLYLELDSGWEERAQSRVYQLELTGYYDNTLRQVHQVELPDPPATYTITWKLPHPPRERPTQTTGIRIFLVDTEGNPVEGVELGGSPYPKETAGDIPDIAMLLGPSDAQGYIRWDSAEPGTYELYGSKDGKSQKFEIQMPQNRTMADITLTWNP